jgi:hypothetical protein
MEIRIFLPFKGFKERPDDWIRGYMLEGAKLMLLKRSCDDF